MPSLLVDRLDVLLHSALPLRLEVVAFETFEDRSLKEKSKSIITG
jgi:hypothetical protein